MNIAVSAAAAVSTQAKGVCAMIAARRRKKDG